MENKLEIQFWCCSGVGHLYSIFKPHCGEFAAFPKQDDKYSTNARGGWGGGGGGGGGGEDWARLEMTELLIENVILPGKLSILCDIQYVNKTARKSFKNIEQLGIFYKVIF